MAKRKQDPAKRKKSQKGKTGGKAGGSSKKATTGSKKRSAKSGRGATGSKKRSTKSGRGAAGSKKRSTKSGRGATGSKKRSTKSGRGATGSKKRSAKSRRGRTGAKESTASPRAPSTPKSGPGTRTKKDGEVAIRELQDALDRALDWLGGQAGFYAYLARRASPRGAPELGRHLQGDIIARQGQDGSWDDGSLTTTAESVWRLLELEISPTAPAIERALTWMYSRRDRDGSFGAGCSPARHEQRICEHFLSGFFSPGPPDESMEISLSNGQTVTSDVGARMLASERALRSALRARPGDPRADSSISGLRSLPLYLDYGGSFTPAVLVGALEALSWVPEPPPGELRAGLEVLAEAQDKDGAWPNVEFFFVLEMLIEANQPPVAGMLRRALPKLLTSQLNDGSWGRRYSAGQTWNAVQVLRRALDEPELRGA